MKWLFRMLFKAIHAILGPVMLFLDWVTSPKGIRRSESDQRAVDARTRGLVLYQYRMCPFCIKTRRAVKRLSLNIETRDALRDDMNRQALLAGAGRIQVPCLRITGSDGRVTWMYESGEIIDYLQQRFAV